MSPLKLLELKSIVEYLSKFDDKSDASPLMLLVIWGKLIKVVRSCPKMKQLFWTHSFTTMSSREPSNP
ncbi:hypothetical protein OSB04_011356 [Centaurea solstitialis]|uniref:Uncharacterized protein n=1 Tax=Centaurea solstitialis TaxID=347529 RepID=A0AA38WDL5_9ASTR|nr:hypothetical protein OSB04_011356 [Centaurea solstitialis]